MLHNLSFISYSSKIDLITLKDVLKKSYENMLCGAKFH